MGWNIQTTPRSLSRPLVLLLAFGGWCLTSTDVDARDITLTQSSGPVSHRFSSGNNQTAGKVSAPRASSLFRQPHSNGRLPTRSPHAAIIRQGRMISTGVRQQEATNQAQLLLQNPQQNAGNQKSNQDIFGEDQSIPDAENRPQRPVPQQQPRNVPQNPQNAGELPSDVFKDPFEQENRGQTGQGGQPELVPVPPQDSDGLPGDVFKNPFENENRDAPNNTAPGIVAPAPNELTDPAPQDRQPTKPWRPKPRRTTPDDGIDYQSGRGLETLPSSSNVYRPPAPRQSESQEFFPQDEIYFVPAYEPLPGLNSVPIAPPATIYSESVPGHSFQSPGAYQQPYPPQYAVPQQHPVAPFPQPQAYAFQPAPHIAAPVYQDPWAGQGGHPQNNVYSSAIPSSGYPQGPLSPVRLRLLPKIMADLYRDWGIGRTPAPLQPQSCADASCFPATAFYFGFQGANSDAFDLQNDQGAELQVSDGAAFYFSLGRYVGYNLRTEAELSFRSNDITGLATPVAQIDLSGETETFSGMANLYWDFNNFPSCRIKPYIGGGVGFISSTLTVNDAIGNSLLDNDNDSSFAYQWMAGVNFRFTQNIDLFGEYRFVEADGFQVSAAPNGLNSDFGYSASSVGIGLRWNF